MSKHHGRGGGVTSPIKGAPVWYRLAMNSPHGGYRLLHYLRKKHKLDRLARFPFHDRTMVAPLNELPPLDWSGNMHVRVSNLAAFCDDKLGSFDFIDCGAHLGTFSSQMTIFSDRVQKLTAIEPNRQIFPLTELNLANANAVQVQCLNAAVSDFEGRGRLMESDSCPGETGAMYMVGDPSGDIPVITLNGVLRDRTQPKVVIKLDVEGAEVPALRGAADAIRSLARVVLFVEIHKDVLRRIGMSDVEMLAAIDAIRPFTWINAQDLKLVDPRNAILDQLNFTNECDLIGISV
jgi:FkbM family methyltransferase